MAEKNEVIYDDETLEFCKHMRIFSNVNRLYILGVLKEDRGCRVSEIVMETGLSYQQVYYHLAVLRKIGYISTRFNKGRYLVSLSFGWNKGQKIRSLLSNIVNTLDDEAPLDNQPAKNPYLKRV